VPKDPANDALAVFNFSTNGIAEYTASNFGGAMQGNLLVAQLDSGGTGTVFRMALGGTNGTYVQTKQQLPVTGYGNDPLDVWAQGDSDPMPGTIWVAMNGSDQITILEPGDYGGGGGGTCSAPDDNGDADGDGYTNHDEIVNGTDPCSAGSIPPDNDGDHVSDKLDPDDDNDGITDLNDAFQTDAQNGLSTQLPVSITWNPTDPDPGGILNSGFTGLMTNGSTDYLTTYDPANMTVGSAAGVFTIDNVPTGDALGTINTQKYGFQFGIDPPSQTFTVHTRVNTPFLGVTPTGQDAMGVTIGAGDQDNYVRLIASANGPSTDGVSFLKEVGGTTSNSTIAAVTLPGPDYIDLYLVVNPVADTVQPRYSVTTNCSTSCQTTAVKDLGSPVAIPASWLAGTSKGLAVGIISTSRNGNAFSATWDSIDVTTSGGGGGGSGTWATLAPTGFARQELPYNVVNGRFYLAGGIAPSGDPRRIQVYDPTTDTWQFTGAILPAALNHMRSAVVNGKIYYIGGYLDTTNEEVGTVSIYDPSTNTVTAGTPMPRPRAAGGVAVYQGKIYYAGGATTGTTAADKTARTWFDVYDPATDSWSQLPDMPRKRDHFAAAVVNGKFYALAGRNKRIGSTWSQNAAYDFGTGTWSENVAPTPTPRGGVATAVIGSQILVIGGERSVNGVKSVLNVVEAYDTSTNTWTTLAPMPTARHGMEAVVYNGKVYVADGSSVSGGGPASSLAVHEVYTP
jgi:N-acetylneuraminic acid mutarotase